MSALFQNKQQNTNLSPLAIEKINLTQKLTSAKVDAWFILAFSVINLIISSSGTYFLFSAELPLYVLDTIKYIGIEMAAHQAVNLSAIYSIAYAASALLLLPYLIFAIFAMKHRWALICELIFISIDTLFCLSLISSDNLSIIIDILIHVIAIYGLAVGIKSYNRLLSLPPDDTEIPNPINETVSDESEPTDENKQF